MGDVAYMQYNFFDLMFLHGYSFFVKDVVNPLWIILHICDVAYMQYNFFDLMFFHGYSFFAKDVVNPL